MARWEAGLCPSSAQIVMQSHEARLRQRSGWESCWRGVPGLGAGARDGWRLREGKTGCSETESELKAQLRRAASKFRRVLRRKAR